MVWGLDGLLDSARSSYQQPNSTFLRKRFAQRFGCWRLQRRPLCSTCASIAIVCSVSMDLMPGHDASEKAFVAGGVEAEPVAFLRLIVFPPPLPFFSSFCIFLFCFPLFFRTGCIFNVLPSLRSFIVCIQGCCNGLLPGSCCLTYMHADCA